VADGEGAFLFEKYGGGGGAVEVTDKEATHEIPANPSLQILVSYH